MLLFEDQYDAVKHVVKTRKKNLASRANIDTITNQPGNLVITHTLLTTSTQGSKELNPTVENIYYVKTVSPTHLRLIHLFNGIER